MSARFGRSNAEAILASYGIAPSHAMYEWFATLLTQVYTSHSEVQRALAASRLAGAAMKSLPLWEEKWRRANAQRTVSDTAIYAALNDEPNLVAAAAALGIDERQIRNRIPREERDKIRKKKRKS